MNLNLMGMASVIFALGVGVAGRAEAQVPSEIARRLVTIGRGVCVQETAELYRPLHSGPPYSGVSISRDVSFGPDPKNVVDVFAPEPGSGSRPVLVYVPGGPGNRRSTGSDDGVFYDNIALWAVKNGMVGVLMQRRPGEAWDDPAKDIAKVIQWIAQNIARYGGDPADVFMWSHSAGTGPVGTYVGHPEFYGPKGVGLKGVVFMSPAFNILPVTPPQTAPTPQCQGVTAPAPAAAPAGSGPAVPPDVQLARSNLRGLINARLPLLVSVAELDPPGVVAFAETLRDQLCGAGRCPMYVVFRDHSHISTGMSANTADESVTGLLLRWMRSIK